MFRRPIITHSLSWVQTCCVSPYRISVDCTPYHLSVAKCWYGDKQRGCSLTWRSFPVASKGRHALQWCQSGRARVASRVASQLRTKDSWSVQCEFFYFWFCVYTLNGMELRFRSSFFRFLLGRGNFVALHRMIRNKFGPGFRCTDSIVYSSRCVSFYSAWT
jgi:hypothetical protein